MGRIADLILRLVGQDEASDVIEHVADVAEPLEDGVEVPVTEEGGEEAAATLGEVGDAADDLDGKEVNVPVETPGADEAKTSLAGLSDAASVMGDAGVTGASGINAISAASVGAVGAIGAAVKVAKESVDAYVQVGIAAQQGGAAVGMSTEEYSRWVEVADDMMIEASALQGALTGLNRKIVSGSEAFAAYGISTVDANGAMRSTNDVMLDVIGVMTAMENPQEAMRVGMELMGPAFKKLAPLIGKTEEEMRAYLASVDEGLVVTDEWAANSLETAQAQDELRDALKVVVFSLGEMVAALSPVIVELAGMVSAVGEVIGPIADLVGGVVDLGSGLKDAIPNISLFGNEFERMGGPIRTVANEIKEFVKGEEDIAPAADEATLALDAEADALGDAAIAAQAAAEAEAALVESLRAEIEVLGESIEANQAKADAMRASTDAEFAALQSSIAFTDTVAGLNEALTEAGGDAEKTSLAWMELGQSADTAADDAVTFARGAKEAQGATLSAAEELHIWNREMLTMASESPLAADAILDVVAAQNEVDPETITEIKALVSEGDIASAVALLDAASAQRSALIAVDTDTAAVAEADAMIRSLLGKPASMPLTADQTAALAAIDTVEEQAAVSTAAINLGADPAKADAAIAALVAGDYETFVALLADVKPAAADIGEVVDEDYETEVTALAETGKAANDLLNLISLSRFADIIALAKNTSETNELLNSTARKRTAIITADANTSAAEKELNNVARTRTARINAAVSRSNVLVRVDGGG